MHKILHVMASNLNLQSLNIKNALRICRVWYRIDLRCNSPRMYFFLRSLRPITYTFAAHIDGNVRSIYNLNDSVLHYTIVFPMAIYLSSGTSRVLYSSYICKVHVEYSRGRYRICTSYIGAIPLVRCQSNPFWWSGHHRAQIRPINKWGEASKGARARLHRWAPNMS